MFNYAISTTLDYFFASRGLNPQIQDHVEDEGLEKAGFILQGTDYGHPMKSVFIEIQNFWAWTDRFGK